MKKNERSFCDWAIKKLDEGAIFICSDESWHEVGGPARHKLKVTKPIGWDSHQWAKPKPPVQFSFMQWGAMTTEPFMGPQHIWEAETKKDRGTIDAQLIEENARVLKDIEGQRERAEIPGTIEYQHMQVRTIIKYLLMTVVN